MQRGDLHACCRTRSPRLAAMPFAAARGLACECLAQTPNANSCVWFACVRTKIEANLPAPVVIMRGGAAAPTTEHDTPELERISMKYFSCISDLKWWCLRVQELAPGCPFPAALVLDDLDLLLGTEVRPRGFAFFAAFLCFIFTRQTTDKCLPLRPARRSLHMKRRSAPFSTRLLF